MSPVCSGGLSGREPGRRFAGGLCITGLSQYHTALNSGEMVGEHSCLQGGYLLIENLYLDGLVERDV